MPRGNQKVLPGDGKTDGKNKALNKNQSSGQLKTNKKGSPSQDDLANNSNGKRASINQTTQQNQTTSKKLLPQKSSSSNEGQGSIKTTAGMPPPRKGQWKWTDDEDPIKLYNMDKHLKFARVPESQLREMERWQKCDQKGHKKTLYIKEVQKRNDNILNVIEQTRLEKLLSYEDRFPCLEARKSILKLRIHITMIAHWVITTKVFENATLAVILMNSLTMVYENPMEEPEPWLVLVEQIFLGLYTVEMCLKILGMGFIFNKQAYLRDVWGCLDFLIVSTAYLTLFTKPEKQGIVKVDDEAGGPNLNALRAFRVLRPLRTITTIKGLRVLVVSILSALPMLKQTVLVLIFFFLIFAIAGVQLLSGSLKQRCIRKATGTVFRDPWDDEESEILCGGNEKCPEGTFCGKTDQNPDTGNTNLDNIFYALLMVFQCTTLEGWSDIQTKYQKTYSVWICLYFLSMVFIGAFFLMNLTLAVINAAFTKSSKEANGKKEEEVEVAGDDMDEINLDDMDDEQEETKPEDIGIAEYYIAKKAATKMIEWLRLRQEFNKQKALKEKEEEKQKILAGVDNPYSMQDSPVKPRSSGHKDKSQACDTGRPMLSQSSASPTKGAHGAVVTPGPIISSMHATQPLSVGPNVPAGNAADLVITEEEHEDGADLQDHAKEVARFLAELESDHLHSVPDSPGRSIGGGAPAQMQKTGDKMMAGIQEGIRQRCWVGNGPDSLKPIKQNSKGETQRGPVADKMTVAGYTFNDRFSDTSKLHDELDFDKIVNSPSQTKIVPRTQQKATKDRYQDPLDSGEGFQSFNDSPLFDSDDLAGNDGKNRQNSLDDLQSVIDSDNSLHQHLENLKQQQQEANEAKQKEKKKAPEVTPMRKEMLKSIKQRIRRHQSSVNFEADPLADLSQSTLEVRKQRQKLNDLASITQMSGAWNNEHGESRATGFAKGLAEGEASPMKGDASIAQLMRMKKENEAKEKRKSMKMEKIDSAFMQSQRPKDPYDFINRKTQKIEINPGVAYKSTSANEVFEPRIHTKKAKQLTSVNHFIQKPKHPDEVESEDFDNETWSMSKCEPWQQKSVYKIKKDEPVDSDSDQDLDDLQDAPQPYETVMSIGFSNQLSHLPTKLLCKRSDILVSSTLSITLTPMETGRKKSHLVDMSDDRLFTWVNLRHEFNAKTIDMHKVPLSHFIPAYYTHQMRLTLKQDQNQQFQASVTPMSVSSTTGNMPMAMQKMQQEKMGYLALGGQAKLIPPCLLREPLSPEQQQMLNEEEGKHYKFQKNKYDAHVRNQKKQEIRIEDKPVSLADARSLMAQTYHENDDDDLLDDNDNTKGAGANENTTKYLSRDEDFGMKNNLEQFEKAVTAIVNKKDTLQIDRNKGDEIPTELRKELDLPKQIGNNFIDFSEVRIKDCNVKRKTPTWSGQDVLSDGLNEVKSQWIASFLNETRVWPKGFYGYVKKFRCLLKILCGHFLFDNAMLLSVILNTIIMAMESNDNSDARIQFLEEANSVFTWIFIVEMSLKLLAIGPAKYVREPMNILDGSVVLLSIFELVMAAGGEGSNLSAFKTIRILRTLRVLRIVRILRALKQMQVIISVIGRSADSFIYIAMLLMVCCFIFTLLGKTIFGNKFNYDPKPRGNFDKFSIALITVFQVLTMENWQTVAFDAMNSEVGKWIPAFYFVSWIFAGNFILLNLFLAILLDSFLEEDEAGELTEDQQAERQEKKLRRKEAKEQERIRKLKKLGTSMMQSGNVQAVIRQQTMKKKAALNQFVNLAHYNKGDDLIVDDIEDLDEEQIKELFMDMAIIKDKTNKRKEQNMYKDVHCELSFYVFPKERKFRDFCYNVQSAKWFDNTIMALIGLNSIKLGLDTYTLKEEEDSPIMKLSRTVDYFFNIAFAAECFFKCIAMGLIMDRGSYLRDGWNQLDFFIVMTSLTDMILGLFIKMDFGVFKILRLLRTLRPLRVISHNVAMKMIVAALFESVGAIFNVLIVVLVVWLMFAILAINLLSGKSFYCTLDKYLNHTKGECNRRGGSWGRNDSNYDNVFQAMMTLFIVSTLEGWPDIMINSVDSTEQNKGPRYEASTNFIYFYIVFIFIGSFFLLNFFIGVLFLEYAKAQREETKGYTPAHINWIAIQTMITDVKVAHDKKHMPEVMWRYKIWKIIESKKFEVTIMVFIVLNMFQMAADFEGAPPSMMAFLRFTNYIFTVVFLAECVLKLLVYNQSYFQTAWNKFDFFVVCASLFDLGLEFVDTESMKDLPIGNVAKVLRVLRVSRVLRLAQSSKELQALIQTITMSVGALVNVFGLLLLILFMFAVLGVFFFNTLSSGEVIDEQYKNFKNFDKAYLLLFAISTGEDWNLLMYDCMSTYPDCEVGATCGVSSAPAFYITFIMVITHVMLNLFILVIIQQFDTYYVAEDNPIKTFKTNFDIFHEAWVSYTQRFRCIKIKEKQLVDFFADLQAPMGMKVVNEEDRITDSELKKLMLKMGIRTEDGWIYFNELLYRCMRRKYGNFKLNKRMQISELKTLFKISLLTLKAKSEEQFKNSKNEDIIQEMTKKNQSVNPFLTLMYYRISFNTWLNATRRSKALISPRHYIEESLVGGVDVLIEVEEIIEVTSEEDADDEDDGILRDIQTGRSLKQSTSTDRLKRKGISSYNSMGKRKGSKDSDLGLKESQKASAAKRARRASARNDPGSSQRIPTPQSVQSDLK